MMNSFDGHFGLCPTCHQSDGYLNIGRGHWFRCDTHRVYWFAGSNLFAPGGMNTKSSGNGTRPYLRAQTGAVAYMTVAY
jgi:hypothetical protein